MYEHFFSFTCSDRKTLVYANSVDALWALCCWRLVLQRTVNNKCAFVQKYKSPRTSFSKIIYFKMHVFVWENLLSTECSINSQCAVGGRRRTHGHTSPKVRRTPEPALHQGHEQVSADLTRVEGFSHTPRFLCCFQYPGYTQEAPYLLTPQFSSPEKSAKPQTTPWSAVFPHLWDAKTQLGFSVKALNAGSVKKCDTFCRPHQTHVRMTQKPEGGRNAAEKLGGGNTGLTFVFAYLLSWTRFKARLA